jgi:hypothetical protein
MKRRQDKKNTVQKQARKDAFLKLGMLFLAVLLVADTIQIARFSDVVERVDMYNKGVVDELGGFRSDIVQFGNDINEMRGFLLLPTKTYSFMEQDEELTKEPESEASETEKALYTFMSSYVEEQSIAKNAVVSEERIRDFNKDADFTADLEEEGLTMGAVEQDEFSISFKVSDETESLFAVIADKKTGEIKIQSIAGVEVMEAEDEDKLKAEIVDFVGENKDSVAALKVTIEENKSTVVGLGENEEAAAILKEKNISFEIEAREEEEKINYNVINSEGETLLTVSVLRKDGSIMIGEDTYEDAESLAEAFMEALEGLDGSTSVEKLINDRRAELEEVFAEEAFKELLAVNGLTVETEPREDYNKLLYDVKDEDGNIVFSFVIELSSGYFKILKDNEEIDLYSAIEGSKKKP